jgi:hypothetical protein
MFTPQLREVHAPNNEGEGREKSKIRAYDLAVRMTFAELRRHPSVA